MASKVNFISINKVIHLTVIVLISNVFSTIFSQKLPCKEQERIFEQSKLDMWGLISKASGDSTLDCNCLGNYFARKDIENKEFHYMTWGNRDDLNTCFKANLSQLGIKINYFEHLIDDATSSFIHGYNEVALAYWKKKLGDSEYKKRFEDSEKAYNPLEKLNENLLILNEFYDFSFINDSTANVKIDTKAILGENAQYVVYTLKSSKDETSEKTMSASQLAKDGYTFKFPKNCSRVHLRISINLKEIYEEKPICNCIPEEVHYDYTMPFNRKLFEKFQKER